LVESAEISALRFWGGFWVLDCREPALHFLVAACRYKGTTLFRRAQAQVNQALVSFQRRAKRCATRGPTFYLESMKQLLPGVAHRMAVWSVSGRESLPAVLNENGKSVWELRKSLDGSRR
jgi:hypothetical protein